MCTALAMAIRSHRVSPLLKSHRWLPAAYGMWCYFSWFLKSELRLVLSLALGLSLGPVPGSTGALQTQIPDH